MTKRVTLNVIGFTCVIWLTSTVQAQKVYWTDIATHVVERADLDGDGQEVIVADPITVSPKGVAVDYAGGKIYWVDRATLKVMRCNLDGTLLEDLSDSGLLAEEFYGIALDLNAGKLYVSSNKSSHQARIQRANLDGTDPELLLDNLAGASSIALDLSAGKMYWTNPWDGGVILRANLDGSDVETIVGFGWGNCDYLNLDVANGKMYWLDPPNRVIRRANLDATGIEDLVTIPSDFDGGHLSRGLALDLSGGKMYWSDHSHLMRANLDGTNVEQKGNIDFQSLMGGIAFDSAGGQLYWTLSSQGKVFRSNSDWEETELIVSGTGHAPRAVELDPVTNNLYWATYIPGGDQIVQANQNGEIAGTIVQLPSANSSVTDIAVCQSLGKLYWVDSGERAIQRADLDGSNFETIVPPAAIESTPLGMTIDEDAGKIYWTQSNIVAPPLDGYVKRANLDGTDIEVIYYAELRWPYGIDIDPLSLKLYVSDNRTSSRKIMRMNLDGTDVETLVTSANLQNPRDIALDIGNGKMYWADGTRIARANLDGSNVEVPLANLGDVHGLALDLFCDLEIYCDVNASGGIPNLDDILCTLRGFANPADCPGADVKPCEANGNINLDDILSVVAAFGGDNACPDKCD